MANPLKPHGDNIMSALSDVSAAHDAIMAAPLTHAERHANRLAELRKRIEENAAISTGIARHTSQA